jgi:hypothetical protein
VLARTLPAILESGLWTALAARAPLPTRALITDVGNDILYGASAAQILEWVETALTRLQAHTRDIVITGLPLDSIRRLSSAKFVAFRTVFYPSCRLPLRPLAETSEHVHSGLARLAADHGARFVPLASDWYGFDPVHIRARHGRAAWREIFGAPTPPPRPSLGETLRIHSLAPEKQRLLGIERVRPQGGVRLPSGGTIWLY